MTFNINNDEILVHIVPGFHLKQRSMKNTLKLAVLAALLSSCGQSASEEAEKLRNGLETQENTIQQDRTTRERQIDEQLNQIKNDRYERTGTEN